MKTFTQALAGRDVANEIRNLRRRLRYQQTLDRPKHWATTPATHVYCGYFRRDRAYTPDHASRDLAVLRNPTSTAEYVAAWTRLNNLKF